MAEPIHLLWVEDSDQPPLSARSIERADAGFDVTVESSIEGARSRLADESADVDCAVGRYDPDADGSFLEAVRADHPRVPTVAIVDADDGNAASAAISVGATDVLRASSGSVQYDLLAHRIRTAVATTRACGDTDRELREARAQLDALSAITADLLACETVAEVAECIVEVAEDALAFDHCLIFLREGEQFVPVAGSTPDPDSERTGMALDHGIIGETYRTGEPILVEDTGRNPVAEPVREEYRSGLSVPIGDVGVFQLAAERADAFAESDLEIVETLVSHATEAIVRARSEARLRAERDRLSALFENVPEAVVAYEIRDGDPIVWEVNTAFEETFGYDAAEIVGENVDEYIIPIDRAGEAERLNEKLAAGESVQVESRRRTRNGERDVLLQVVPLVLGEHNVEGFAIYTDITDQKARERELQRQNERLEEFAGVVSHDLRNPLSIAQGHVSLARDRCSSPETDGHFEAIANAHDRMAELIEDVLTLARQGQTVGETRPVDLAEAVSLAWGTVTTEDATLETEDLDTVVADPDRLRQLLENLFRNAVEHAGPGVTVRVGSTPRGFFVADDGPGIPPDRREQVFEAGHTDAEDGTGFGLAIVKSVVEAHGWTIEVTESEAGGARFEIEAGE